MSKHAAFYVAIFATAALAIGWNSRGFSAARGDVRSLIGRLANTKKERDRYLGTAALLAVITAAVLFVVATGHR